MSKRTETRLVHGRPLRFLLRRSTRARHLRVEVSRRDGVVVVLPRRATVVEAEALLAESADWLASQATTHGVWNGPRRRQWVDGAELGILGRPTRLELRPLPAGKVRVRAKHSPGVLRLELPPMELLDPRPALENQLRKLAGRHLRERTDFWSARTGLEPTRVIVGERTSRWGSCSPSGTVSYCYRLILAPYDVVDSIVVHELCHLRHRNHGPRFHKLVEKYTPEHGRHMDWLRDHGQELEI